MRRFLPIGFIVGLLTSITPAAFADSFAINEYSARDLGLANAGRTTLEDVSAAWGNPAMLAFLHQRMVGGSLSGILGDANYRDRGSIDALGAPLGGDTSGFLKDAIVPALHMSAPINDRFVFGLAVTAPFGLSTKYDDDWPGRYQAVKSSLQTIDINPSLSWKINDQLAFGIGVSAQYAKAHLTSAIDFGAVCFGQLSPTTCAGLGLNPQNADGLADIEGDDWAVGWNAGLAWTPANDWRVGLTYRSRIDHDLKGAANFTVPTVAMPLTATGAFTNTSGSAALDLPAATELGARWQATNLLALYGGIQWKDWTPLKQLAVSYDNPAQPDTVEQLNYKSSVRYSFGGEYALTPKWTLRAGLAFDQSPTQSAYRTARIPDNDRTVYAIGASWKPTDAWSLDMAYNRVNIDDTSFDKIGTFDEHVIGLYAGHADVVSIGASRTF
ncbi:MAG: TonB-dependent receptor [Hyphomonadaceae bacterium]